MSRPKPPPLPDNKVHNLRKRAEQMRFIASAVARRRPRDVLIGKAEELERLANQAEIELQSQKICAPERHDI